MSWIDLLFLAIVAVFAFFSYRRGFMRTLLEVVAFVLAIVLASFLAKPVGGFFYNSFIKGSVENHIENSINEINFDSKKVSKEDGANIVFDNIGYLYIPRFNIMEAPSTALKNYDIKLAASENRFGVNDEITLGELCIAARRVGIHAVQKASKEAPDITTPPEIIIE